MADTQGKDKLVGTAYAKGSKVLTITYVSVNYGATHSVTVRDSYHDWIDVEMGHTELGGRNTWTTDLVTPADEDPVRIEFKLVLDGQYWMSGWNQVGSTAHPAAVVDYDDSAVIWETEPH